MKENKNIGLIGLGFVGNAFNSYVKHYHNICSFDLVKKSSCKSIEEVVNKSEIIFVCLPTPMRKDGSCDISIVHSVVKEINHFSVEDKVVVLKSTIPVGTTRKLNLEFSNINIVFNPEFLTEANSIDDFANQNRIIIGGEHEDSVKKVYNLYFEMFENSKLICTDSQTAEMVKYTTNCFLATKVSFANEIKNFCDVHQINYDKMIEISVEDKRLGFSHWQVPGPDGKNGFGGSCFPKDMASLVHQFSINDLKSYVISSAWNRNIELDRKDQDWKILKGRAISEEE